MITTASKDGEIVLPAELVRQDGIEPGEEVEVKRTDAGQYQLARREPSPEFDLVDWLLACPVKDFFVPIPSESTDDL